MDYNLQEKHIYTSDEKLQWWGYGEWVEESDLVEFDHNGIKCKIVRIVIQEPYSKEFHMFGGHLCGYINIPKDHPYFGKEEDEIDLNVHGGLTFSEFDKDSEMHWIGFDCAHLGDIIPSTEHLKKTTPELIKLEKENQKLKEKFGFQKSPIFHQSYKNINYCIEECKSMAKQLNLISMKKLET